MKLTTLPILAILLSPSSAFKHRGQNIPARIIYTCDTAGGTCNDQQLHDAIYNRCQALGGNELYNDELVKTYDEPGHLLKSAWGVCLCAHGNIKPTQDYHFDGVEPHGNVHINIGLGTTFSTCQATGGGQRPPYKGWPPY